MLNFEKLNGLIPVIIQDYKTNKVLMLGFMNQEAYELTLKTGRVHYFSRTRNKIWLKGEKSKHYQIVKEIYIDCDNDTLLIKIEQIGNATCHEGYDTCFYRMLVPEEKITGTKVFNPAEVYK